MAKTNKEFRSDLAKEMRNKRKEKNIQLEQVESSKFSQWLKEQMSKEIKENFEKKIDEIKSRPWYEEARKTHLEEINAKSRLTKAKKELEDAEKSYNEAQIAHRWKVEKFSENDAENFWELSQEKKEKLYWNRVAIIKDLKENYLKEKDAEMMWYKWKEVHLSLPAVWNFKWFKLDYFVSNDFVYKEDFESNPELEKKSKSMKQIWEILKAVNRYMAELWVENDWDMDYENDLQDWKTEKYGCKAWDCLKDISGLNELYWTGDKGVDGIKDSRVLWDCYDDDCDFTRCNGGNSSANLFLRLSD